MPLIRSLLLIVVFAPALQASSAVAASTSSGGKPVGANNVAGFGGDSGRFAVNGHTKSAGKLTPSFVKNLRKSAGDLPGSSKSPRVVQFGVIRHVGTHTLELSRPSKDSLKSGSRILYSIALENFLSHVSVPRLAWLQLRNPQGHLSVQRATSLGRLHAGSVVFVAGDAAGGTLRARIISTLAGAKIHSISVGSVNLRNKPHSDQSGGDPSTTVDFGGTSQLGNYSFAHDFKNTLIFTIGVVDVRLRTVTFTAGLGGAFYRWPFEFSATPRTPLVMGQPNTTDLQVTPKTRSDGGYTLNFTSGIDAGVGLYVWTAVGCGFLALKSCQFTPTPHIGLGMSLGTRSAAPMPGASLKLTPDTCPTAPIFAIPVVNFGLVLKGCLAILLHGNTFNASISASGAQVGGKTNLDFDGKTPQSVTLTPTASQVNLTFSYLGYYTTWDVGIEPILALNPVGLKYSLGTLNFVTGQRKDWIGNPIQQKIDLIFPLNQPDKVVIPLAASNSGYGGSEGARLSVFATGLTDPRGLRFGPDGSLYVAEAGTGGDASTAGISRAANGTECVQSPSPTTGGGFSARVSKIDPAGNRTTVMDQLPSGTFAGTNIGVSDVDFVNGNLYALLEAGGCSHGHRDIPNGVAYINQQFGTYNLIPMDNYFLSHPPAFKDPSDYDPNGNLYSMTTMGGNIYTAEANHGEIDKVTPNGAISRVIDLSTALGANAWVGPTAITNSGGNLFVANLGEFPVTAGSQKVWKIAPDGSSATVFASGLTAVTGITADKSGNLYASELSTAAGEPTPYTGEVVKIATDGTVSTLASGLAFPTGITVGPDGNLYVSTFSFGFQPDLGEVDKITLNG